MSEPQNEVQNFINVAIDQVVTIVENKELFEQKKLISNGNGNSDLI